MDQTKFEKHKQSFSTNKLFSELTTLKIGGPAKYFTIAKTRKDLVEAIKFAKKENLNFLVIGGGSNLLVSDDGYDGLVIKNEIIGVAKDGSEEERRYLPSQLAGRSSPSADGRRVTRPSMKVSSDATELVVQAGTELQELVDYTIKHGLSGLHKLTGIPGSLGGAIFGNAGAFGQTISDQIKQVVCFNPGSIGVNGANIITLSKQECKFEYRASIFKKNGLIILEIHFSLPSENQQQLQKEAQDVLEMRKEKYQPGILCPGSFFKNLLDSQVPENILKTIPNVSDFYGKVPAWYFLEAVGAKGDGLGNTKIAPFHANLFINEGGGKAEDLYNLAKKYYSKVKAKFAISLEPEVQLVNLPPLS